MKNVVILVMFALVACNSPKGEPAPPGYWHEKMCVQERYKHLDQCKEHHEEYAPDISGVIGQM